MIYKNIYKKIDINLRNLIRKRKICYQNLELYYSSSF